MRTGHPQRHELAGEHPFTDAGQLLLFSIFFLTWVSDSFFLRYSVFLSSRVPFWVRLAAGLAVLLCSLLLVLSAHRAVFGRPAGGGAGPICNGAFSIARHPMYLGSWLCTVGLVLATFSLSAAALSLAILVFYRLVAKKEEMLLVKKFGDQYREYQGRVPMFFPRPFSGGGRG